MVSVCGCDLCGVKDERLEEVQQKQGVLKDVFVVAISEF